MDTTRVDIHRADGTPLQGSKGLIWGNNAAWLCACGELCVGRTGDTEYIVTCPGCRRRHEILRAPNKNGKLNLGRATGIRVLV